MPQINELVNGLGEAELGENNTYRWSWTQDHADSQNSAREPEAGLHVHKWRCCNSSVTIPHFRDVDGFSGLVTAGLTLTFLLIAFSTVLPQFDKAQEKIWRGASALVANDTNDQWVLCPDVWRHTSSLGEARFKNYTLIDVLKITCWLDARNPDHIVSMALPKEALVLLGFMSFFFKSPAFEGNGSRWCYTEADMVEFFKPG